MNLLSRVVKQFLNQEQVTKVISMSMPSFKNNED